jgi:hypothetical protein
VGTPGVGAGHKSPCPTGKGKGSPPVSGQARSQVPGAAGPGTKQRLHPQAEELVNTAPLTGVPQRVPVRLVTVDAGGTLVEVTEHIGCESANTQVLQVSGRCPCCLSMHFLGAQSCIRSSPPTPEGPQENSFSLQTS